MVKSTTWQAVIREGSSLRWAVTRNDGQEWAETASGRLKRFRSYLLARSYAKKLNAKQREEPEAVVRPEPREFVPIEKPAWLQQAPCDDLGRAFQSLPRIGKVELKVPVDADLAASLDELLTGRGITLADAVSLYLRSVVNSFDRGKALRLSSKMPFGKYRGEIVETIARADPSYFRFLLSGDRPIMLEPEVMALLV